MSQFMRQYSVQFARRRRTITILRGHIDLAEEIHIYIQREISICTIAGVRIASTSQSIAIFTIEFYRYLFVRK